MSSLQEETLEVFNLLNVGNISSEWTQQVWDDDFYEYHGFPEEFEQNITEKQFYKKELELLLSCCQRWTSSEGKTSFIASLQAFLL